MSNRYESTIIHKLLDKYESSKSFVGANKVNQNFTVKVATLFPKYADHANIEVFQAVNEAIDILIRKGLVASTVNSASVYGNISLNLLHLEASYAYVDRKSKQNVNEEIEKILLAFKNKHEILQRYCNAQLERVRLNKPVQYFSGDINELNHILTATVALLHVENETFLRDFSMQVFKNSKTFEAISAKVVGLLYEFGDFPDKEELLGSLNIVKNPTYVNFKGAGIIAIGDQAMDLNKINGDIAISSSLITSVNRIQVTGQAVITIENLTSFNAFNDKTMLAIYLGGYHNKIRRDFIKKVYAENREKDYYHFGDIDAGGFYILNHLNRETGVDFKPYKMDVDTLHIYADFMKPLTENDRVRLLKLKESTFKNVISYMLENNCKLEQEAIISKLY
ncbi:MAG: DUF2399 domain-containing protein [Hyphomonadaceae bacterium]|nr:DUF2399 domain-containing protein [Clostridia bacterium]